MGAFCHFIELAGLFIEMKGPDVEEWKIFLLSTPESSGKWVRNKLRVEETKM